ncbi:acyl carrier protein [Novosphingobium sp.]|jgi:acyl carrier protein|uniref:acyl carrier protein n=1 Tax=Novosphingobium sp. TaxID=1874826 RepID=UPI0022BBA20D|nr:acyl carrier protein [Novosphingobium sp.]MCZ8019926.1 acyl carrier protein [Novosphingobium sp.]MCZ8033556.1 acyl carrier protein [Novosphingobium sp.]MCZ8050912.1 acyl carrier protein [Novosphingobium sp.]MCZ8059258.1 acyl carrier protein [Novosphingobium sp.]MCZ8231096.1 acyl carrier protein [Novosphingobium sp.]
MNRTDLRAMIVEEIGNIAPEVEAATLGDGEDLRKALDLDSMDIFNLVVALSLRLGIDIPDADAGQLVTLGGGAVYLERRLTGPALSG